MPAFYFFAFFTGLRVAICQAWALADFLNNPLNCVLIRVVPEVGIPRYWGEIPDGYFFLFPSLSRPRRQDAIETSTITSSFFPKKQLIEASLMRQDVREAKLLTITKISGADK